MTKRIVIARGPKARRGDLNKRCNVDLLQLTGM